MGTPLQGNRISSERGRKHPLAYVIGPCGLISLRCKPAAQAFHRAQEVQGDMPDNDQVFSSVGRIDPTFVFTECDIKYPVKAMVSRPGGSHPQPLAEPHVNLSAHTAPIRQTSPPFHAASAQTVAGFVQRFSLRICSLVFCVAAVACTFASPKQPESY